MIRYVVSTVDLYDDGPSVGEMVTDSEWSANITSEAESVKEAIRKETDWLVGAVEEGPRFHCMDGSDAETGLIWWTDIDGDKIVTVIHIELVGSGRRSEHEKE